MSIPGGIISADQPVHASEQGGYASGWQDMAAKVAELQQRQLQQLELEHAQLELQRARLGLDQVQFVRDVSPLVPLAQGDPIQFFEAEAALHRHASDLAEDVRSEYGTDDYLVVDVFAIANKIGLRVISKRLNDPAIEHSDAKWVSGVLEKMKGQDSATIYVEADDPLVRQRFSTAHEIWHWKQHTDGRTPDEIREMEFYDVREPERDHEDASIDEYLGDLFAQVLLLPRYVMLSELASGYSMQAIADRSCVSLRTVENRLRQLALVGV